MDGFYDVGHLKNVKDLKSLEEYGKTDINQKRPIILINPKPELVHSK